MKFTQENINAVQNIHGNISPSTIRAWRKRDKIPDKYINKKLITLVDTLTPQQIEWARERCSPYVITPEQWADYISCAKHPHKINDFGGDAIADFFHLLNTQVKSGQSEYYYVKCLSTVLSTIKKKYQKTRINGID